MTDYDGACAMVLSATVRWPVLGDYIGIGKRLAER